MFNSPVSRTVEEAQAELLAQLLPLPVEHVALTAAVGRTVAEDILATEHIPPFANSAMDGYAAQAADLVGASPSAPATLAITAHVPAGAASEHAVVPGTAVRIMTGAPLPPGADVVVPFEATDEVEHPGVASDTVKIFTAYPPQSHIRPAGEDLQPGALVVARGTVLHPGHIAALATVGAAHVPVFRRPRVAILATGDELVAIDQTPDRGQIRNSNSYAAFAQVLEAGGEPLLLPIARDTEADLLARIHMALDLGADLFVTSGGVSVGDYDVVRQVLTAHGTMTFWRVRMRPGKPIMVGMLHAVPLIGLPGNPASAMVCFELFARPAIRALAGCSAVLRPTVPVQLLDHAVVQADRRQYLRVRVAASATGLQARLSGAQGSGITSSLARANGLLVVEAGSATVHPGAVLPALLLAEPFAGG